MAAVRSQCHSLLDRLEGMWPGETVTASGRRRKSQERDYLWSIERKPFPLSAKLGFNIFRRGFAKLDYSDTDSVV